MVISQRSTDYSPPQITHIGYCPVVQCSLFILQFAFHFSIGSQKVGTWEFHEQGGKQAVRKQNWKAVKLEVFSGEKPTLELYDLSADPSEQNNVAASHPEIMKEMEQLMKEAHTSNPIFTFYKEEKLAE